MSSRSLRRHEFASSLPDAASDSEAEAEEPQRAPALFRLLEEEQASSDDDDDEGNDEVAAGPSSCEADDACARAATSSHRPSNRERRALRRGTETNEALSLTGVVGTNEAPSGMHVAPAPAPAPIKAPRDPWRLSSLHVDVTNELSKVFGRHTIRQAAQERKAAAHGRQAAAAAAKRELALRTGGGGRGRLIRPRDTWPPFGGCLGMEIDREVVEPTDATARCFTFTMSSSYRQSQRELEEAVDVGDPELLRNVVQRHPCQVDGLLRLGEYCGKTGQLELAAELTERALWCCEQALHPMCSLLDGSVRLQYSKPTNQPFFIALFRHMIGCGRRGCPRTALEVGRLLLSLDPAADPMHTLLHLDFYSLRAADDDVYTLDWLLQLPQQLPTHSLALYPNIAFSLALARRKLHERCMHRERRMDQPVDQTAEIDAAAAATSQLRRALLLFPSGLPLLLCKMATAGQPPLPPPAELLAEWAAVHGQSADQDGCGATLRKLFTLYAEKCVSLWSARNAREWLLAEATQLASLLKGLPSPPAAGEMQPPVPAALPSEARHLLRLWQDCKLVSACEYPVASSGRFDEYSSADVADFSPNPPDALPADQLEAAAGQGAAGRWVRHAPRQLRPEGRLVVPRKEWLVLDPATHPLKQFFLALLPWAVAPRHARR